MQRDVAQPLVGGGACVASCTGDCCAVVAVCGVGESSWRRAECVTRCGVGRVKQHRLSAEDEVAADTVEFGARFAQVGVRAGPRLSVRQCAHGVSIPNLCAVAWHAGEIRAVAAGRRGGHALEPFAVTDKDDLIAAQLIGRGLSQSLRLDHLYVCKALLDDDDIPAVV